MQREHLQVGDHLVTPRHGYTHHGLYLGNGDAIHYKGFAHGMSKDVIGITSIDEFCAGHNLHVENHLVRAYNREESIERAYSRIGEDWYNLLANNCEHFVNWCIFGIPVSGQVNRVALSAVAASRAQNALIMAKTLLQQETIRQGSVILTKEATVQVASTVVRIAAAAQGASATASVAAQGVSTAASVAAGAGLTAGGIAAGLSTGGGAVVVGLTGASAATVLAPLAVGVAAFYGVKKVIDWFD